MTKTILITGSTDGIGLATAELLASSGQKVILHGRNPDKLARVAEQLSERFPGAIAGTYTADISTLAGVRELASAVKERSGTVDVLVNNAGVYRGANGPTADGIDLRFAVNTVAPFFLTRLLLPIIPADGRVINLSSAAQSSVDLRAMLAAKPVGDGEAYAQSKLALTMWSEHLASELGNAGPAIIAINPGSFLGTKMVQDAYGSSGNDISIGASILAKAALDDAFAGATGRYFDNDTGRFAAPHPDAANPQRVAELMEVLGELMSERQQT